MRSTTFQGRLVRAFAVAVPAIGLAVSTTSLPVQAASDYQDPLKAATKLVPARIDQGVDYYASGGNILALGDGSVNYESTSGWNPGGKFISYRLTDGSATGYWVYVAECINLLVPLKQPDGTPTLVYAGEPIASIDRNCPIAGSSCSTFCIETGWACSSRNVLGSAEAGESCTNQDQGHITVATAYGSNFNSLLKMLGAPSGIQSSTPLNNPAVPATWPTWIPVRGMALLTATSGETLFGTGYVAPFGGAATLNIDGQLDRQVWNWDAARAIALCTDTAKYLGGYEVDLYGGVHTLGAAPHVTSNYYVSGKDVVRGAVLRSDCVTGYILDAYGVVHPFAADGYSAPAIPVLSASWPNFDIARSIDYVGTVNGVDSGFVLDGYGGVHPWGSTSQTIVGTQPTYWPSWDIARRIVPYIYGNQYSGYVLDGYGGVHPFGSAPVVTDYTIYWGVDVARGIAIWPGATSGYYVDTVGSVQTFYVSNQPCCAPARNPA